MSPAHLRELAMRCGVEACQKQAVVELRNTWNEPIGQYCRPHGEKRLAEQLRAERRS